MKKIIFTLLLSMLVSVFVFSQVQLTFRFSNAHVISGTPDVFQFDVDVKASEPGTFQRDMQIYLDYNTAAFGVDMVDAGKITVSQLSLMSDHYQIVNIADNTESKFAIITDALEELNQNGSEDYFNQILTTFEGLIRIEIEISDIDEFTGISFDEELMNGGQYQQSGSSTDPIAYLNPNIYENSMGDLSFIGQDLQFEEGWTGVSSYMLPFDPELENLLDPITGELVILQNFSGIYMPSMGVNTIGNWDNISGYVVKVNNDCELRILGSTYEGNALTLTSGWNLMPILTDCDVITADLFSTVLSSIVIIQEVAGSGIYWPAMGINSLPFLVPGKAYYVKMSAGETIDFPSCE